MIIFIAFDATTRRSILRPRLVKEIKTLPSDRKFNESRALLSRSENTGGPHFIGFRFSVRHAVSRLRPLNFEKDSPKTQHNHFIGPLDLRGGSGVGCGQPRSENGVA
ncbi:hypothetical protein Trydic_g3252 [Trypoxylus dichotomus]